MSTGGAEMFPQPLAGSSSYLQAAVSQALNGYKHLRQSYTAGNAHLDLSKVAVYLLPAAKHTA
jgi:hypothetical protein